jgi:antitoxin component HigA of HigAB toxin-antitoxin module
MQKILEIQTEDDYRDALLRFIHLCDTQKTDEDLRELLLLTRLMEKYEMANCGAS